MYLSSPDPQEYFAIENSRVMVHARLMRLRKTAMYYNIQSHGLETVRHELITISRAPTRKLSRVGALQSPGIRLSCFILSFLAFSNKLHGKPVA